MTLKFNPLAGNFDYAGSDGKLSINGSILSITPGNSVDLSTLVHPDSRTISSGVLDASTGIVTFTRDDSTTFELDLSSIQPVKDLVESVNGKIGIVVLTKTDVGLENVDNTNDLNKPISTATQQALDTKSDSIHDHAGVYEPVDPTILRDSSIGVKVQPFKVGTVVDAGYVHTDNNYTTSEKTKLGGIAEGANAYVHPPYHSMNEISGLQAALVSKVDESRVLTDVPMNAKFTDTVYDDTAIDGRVTTLENAGYLTTETITSLSLVGNVLTFTDEAGNITSHDLSVYLDDTNLARLVSGTYDAQSQSLIFTRDDASTFSVDASMFFDDTNIVTSVNGKTGTVTITAADVGLENVDNTSDLNKPISTATQMVLNTKSDVSHDHTGVYEPADSTILKNAAIGVTIQPFNTHTVVDSNYVRTDHNYTTAEKTKLAGIAPNANNYTHPSSHSISEITGLQSALNSKVDTSQVLTPVPLNALFTDTIYDDSSINGRLTTLETAGYLTSETITSLSLTGNVLTFVDEAGNTTNHDLSLYLDDTNLARLVGGVYDAQTKSLVFSRDDDSTFSVDASMFFDDTNLVTSVSGKTGIVLLSKEDVGLDQVDNTSDLDKPVSTATQQALDAKSAVTHNHDGVYEPVDVSILRASNIGVEVQAFDPHTVSDAGYKHIAVTNTSVSDGTNTFTQYTHPTTHSINEINGLQSVLDTKVDVSRVLTDVPAGAVFTDTIYDDSGLTSRIVALENTGITAEYHVTEADVVAHQAAIRITQSQITDLALNYSGNYVDLIGAPTTLSFFTNDVGYLTSFTETDPIFTAWDKSSGIAITESQITDLKQYLTAETVTSLSLVGNLLSFTDESGITTTHDLTKFLDDTNLVTSVNGQTGAVDLSNVYQAKDANIVSDENYTHIDVTNSSVSDGTHTFNQYVHPVSHSIAEVTGLQTLLDGKSDTTHVHDGVYEPLDSTILRDADIGVVVQPFNAATVVDGAYVHTDANYTIGEKTKLAGIADGANAYVHPSFHSINEVDGLQVALDGKVDDSRVLTDVPMNALFTDTIYDDSALDTRVTTLETSGYLTSETITSLSLVGNVLTFTDEAGNTTNHDLSIYLDDTNLARLVSGTYDSASQTLIFTRDDNSTFSVDASMFFDDTNLVTSVNGQTGAVDLSTVYQPLDANIVSDVNYQHIDVTNSSVSDGINTFNQYVHPSSHSIGEVTGLQTALDGKSDVSHNHDAVYEPLDATILRDADIGVVVQPFNVGVVVDAGYVHTDANYTIAEKTKLAGIADGANAYVHPTTHSINEVTGLQALLDGKVDTSQVLTPVPLNALFTDTIYDDSVITSRVTTLETAGYLTSETITSLSLTGNVLTFTDEAGIQTHHDLSIYLDDTNLARLVSGTYDSASQTLIFTRDDASTFSVDASMFFDDTNLVTSVNGKTGTVTITATDVGLSEVDNTSDMDKPVSTAVATLLNTKAEATHTHTGVYQPLDTNIVSDAGYKHITVTSNSVSDGTNTFNQYDDSNVLKDSDVVTPVSEINKLVTQSDIASLGSGGDMFKSIYDTNNNGIVDNAEKVNGLTVETSVPLNALFTDTIYDDSVITSRVTALETAGYITNYTETDPIFTAWDKSSGITITESQITDFKQYLTSETITSLSLTGNVLTFTDEAGIQTHHDLSIYLDDTNLARLISGTYDAQTQSLIFTRDDNSTFSVDASMFFDDTNLVTSVDGQTGAVDLSTIYQSKDPNIVSDAGYKHITVTQTSVSDGTNVFNQYVHPTTHSINEISGLQAALDGKSNVSHNHDGVYELADPTILRDADIGVVVQPFNASTVVDSGYVHTDANYTIVEKTKLAGIEDGANAYVHPSSHSISEVTGLQAALDSKLTEETLTSLTLVNNTLTYTDENGTPTNIDLSVYLDADARAIASGTLNSVTGIVTFTRDDSSTFTLDLGALLDDTNLVTSVAGKTGVVVLTKSDITDFNASDYATASQGIKADSALQPDAIGTTVQGFNASTVIDANYAHITVTNTSVSDGTNTFTKYVHPVSHSINEINGLQAALDGKVDDSQVLTNVPAGAVFTDTIYDDTVLSGRVTTLENAGIDHLSDVSITNPTVGQTLYFDGTTWINSTVEVGAGGIIKHIWSGNVNASSGTTTMLVGTTPPSVTEGSQIWSQTLTPLTVSSSFSIQSSITVACGTKTAAVSIALFRNNVYIAGTTQVDSSSNNTTTLTVTITDTPNTTSPVNYQLRIGSTSGSWYVNRRISEITYGGLHTGWTIMEY